MEQPPSIDNDYSAKIKSIVDSYIENGNINSATTALINLTGGPVKEGHDISPEERMYRIEGMHELERAVRQKKRDFLRKLLISPRN